jgi:2-polyprenyl-3-methyl-5-hydroxy-6-metoxy-1,4-benzoquinol methylase
MTDDNRSSPPTMGLIKHPIYGFYSVPEHERPEVALDLYEQGYYEEMVAKDRRFEHGEDERRESEWKICTVYADWIDILRGNDAGPRLLDIGAGLGEAVEAMSAAGFDATGLEPSAAAVQFAVARGRRLVTGHFPEGIPDHPAFKNLWDVIVLSNVLEHVMDPDRVVSGVAEILRPGGLAIVRVPNDFTQLQEDSRRAVAQRPWWVAVPHHLHYFSYENLPGYLWSFGLEEVDRLSDFPMELFLLMGTDYTRDSDAGKAAHASRRRMDMAMSPEARRALYRALAHGGVGRNTTLFVRKMA